MTAPAGSKDAGLVPSAEEREMLEEAYARWVAWRDRGDFLDYAAPAVERIVAARVEAARAEERERIAAALKVESDRASVRELSDPNAYARRCAYDKAARIARTPPPAGDDERNQP